MPDGARDAREAAASATMKQNAMRQKSRWEDSEQQPWPGLKLMDSDLAHEQLEEDRLQYDSAEWKPAFLRQAREFLFFPLLPREASK